MRIIILWGIVMSFAAYAHPEKNDSLAPKSAQKAEESKNLSKITTTCLSHLASLISQQKKAGQNFEGVYCTKTDLGTIEYEVIEKANHRLLLLAQVEVYRYGWLPDKLSTYFAKASGDLGDKLRAELDYRFGKTFWQWVIWDPIEFEVQPDALCKCRFFSRGNKKTVEQNFYTCKIDNIPKESLASFVKASEQTDVAEHSLSHLL